MNPDNNDDIKAELFKIKADLNLLWFVVFFMAGITFAIAAVIIWYVWNMP